MTAFGTTPTAAAAVVSATIVSKERLPTVPVEGLQDFEWSYQEEPHATRRKQILAKYGPQVRALYGSDSWLKWRTLAAVVAQLYFAYLAKDMPWVPLVLLAYTIGGTISHNLTLSMHEISHNLAFASPKKDRWLGLFANVPLVVASFISFKRYHTDHHQFQGMVGLDVDVPTAMEGHIFTNGPLKFLWMIMQPLFYALRPLVTVPKPATVWEGINWVIQIAVNVAVIYVGGPKSFVYLLASMLLGTSLHPMAGHFVAEHYAFARGQETYSYYGPLNVFSHHVGLHNEHHDFPFIPGCRLHLLHAIAPEFYEPLACHYSWVNVLWAYITNPTMGPFRRIMRHSPSALLEEQSHMGVVDLKAE